MPVRCEASGFGLGGLVLSTKSFVRIKPKSLTSPSKGCTVQGEPDQMCSIIPLTEGSCLHFTFVTSHPGKPRNTLRDKSQQVWVVLAGETRSLLDRGLLCLSLIFGMELTFACR